MQTRPIFNSARREPSSGSFFFAFSRSRCCAHASPRARNISLSLGISRWFFIFETGSAWLYLFVNPIRPEWGGGGRGGSEKCPRRFQLSRISLIFKQYLPNVATFTKIYWKTRLCKKFTSRVSLVGMATPFLTQCLFKFWLFKDFSPLINEIF